ncbi:Retrotransposon-derived protein PEG10 [Anabarilius grahami]|uniref:Retrotransposon-derived protein PEG10 n=1 Tax=Anabarilius grahami TaxID=495550 RepID=A0A3N0YP36_ANAGA|nr:Retrotransposon-derived protein PEG10 [Anabarilius grahami]
MTHNEEQAYHVTFQELTEASRDRYNHGYNMQIDTFEDKYTIAMIPTYRLNLSAPDPFQEVVDALKRALSGTTSTSPVTITPSPPVVSSPVASPAPYSGSAEDCVGFLLQCSLALEMLSHCFTAERAKIGYIFTLLKGRALHWAQTIWNQGGVVTQTIDNFTTHFREVFGIPDSDSSVGEQLYHLSQGKMSVSEYALQFRTLAVASSWNKCSLINTYRQGLNPRLRQHLATYNDAIGLERFNHLSIRTDRRMQPCLEDLQGQPSPPRPRQPKSTSSPEPEAMQLDNTHLTVSERQRRLTQGLCLYCGSVITACPIRPPRPMYMPSSTLGQLETSSPNPFAASSTSRKRPIETHYQVQSIFGKLLNKRNVRHAVGLIQLKIGQLHMESIVFLVLENSTAGIILGRPRLVQHNPILSWNTGEVLKWGDSRFPRCFPSLPHPVKPLSQHHLYREPS